jgi:hypothetical protein
MNQCRAAGLEVTYDWTLDVEAAGGGNPPTLSRAECFRLARQDLNAIDDADIFWLLVPDELSQGAFCELGYAIATRKAYRTYSEPSLFKPICVVASGPFRSIFQYVPDNVFDTHEEAFHAIVNALVIP